MIFLGAGKGKELWRVRFFVMKRFLMGEGKNIVSSRK